MRAGHSRQQTCRRPRLAPQLSAAITLCAICTDAHPASETSRPSTLSISWMESRSRNFVLGRPFVSNKSIGGIEMKFKTLAFAAAFGLATSIAHAQSPGNTAGGSSQAGGPAASKTTTGSSMNGSTTGAMAMHKGKHHRMHRRHHHRK